ncbi:ProQ/FINO family protein [Acidovorax sp. 62]|uniref:ProQ/FINO family protein n=1 Tax=Acidovorax sp. 62 TaxID=2035203 RepID=UPI000C177870|nr:ProQ/FINO family protein [Acidovorax sp. 62]PIF92900.1 ProQ/FINO family protein [Acidovorax sp. 62]
MTESVPEVVAAPLPADAGAAHAGAALAGAASESATATTPEGAAAADRAGNAAGRAARNRGRRGGKDRGGRNPEGAPAAAQAPAPQRVHPALEQLAGLYPHLFGAVFRPLKRGIFQDLLAAHPELFEREALKVALGIHTRSTRYLQTVAAGEQRHDLQGQPVEAMAPEHVHHALLEVYRRRKNQKGRPTEDLLPKLRNRMIAAFEASGLTREAYTELVVGRDVAANAILEEAFAEWAARNAKAEALLRAFEASGSTLEQFADMYGMDPRSTGQQLERARKLAAAKAAPQADGGAAG